MMVSPDAYDSLGELLNDSLIQFKSETALIEMNRKRVAEEISYLDFRRTGMKMARRLQNAEIGGQPTGGEVKGVSRVAILMGNQSKWLLSAFGALYRGAILVPLDYKLTAKEQAALLAHAKPDVLITEYAIWHRLKTEASLTNLPLVLVSEVPRGMDLAHDKVESVEPWEDLPEASNGSAPTPGKRLRDDVATIVYSSGTGGRPKGCLLTHGNYLSQLNSLTALFPMESGDRYFSILPTNHAIDFMCGFVGPLTGGATVVHQRALRPEFIRHTMKDQKITHMALVPLLLEAFERTIRERLDEAPAWAQKLFDSLADFNERMTRRGPKTALSRQLLKPVHDAFGGHLKLLFCGGAFVDRERAEYFYRLGLPVVIGYGLTEACTVATVNDLKPFRGDTVGRAVEGTEIRIESPDAEGVGEVWLRGPTIMKGYLEEPELTEETLAGGWLHTGDLGWVDPSGHLHLCGRAKNMIVTAGGKNVYPEDIEMAFDGLPADELAIFATNYLWPKSGRLDDQQLIAVVRTDDRDALLRELQRRNQKLADYKRVESVLFWEEEFPRTASMKVKRPALADVLRTGSTRDDLVSLSPARNPQVQQEAHA